MDSLFPFSLCFNLLTYYVLFPMCLVRCIFFPFLNFSHSLKRTNYYFCCLYSKDIQQKLVLKSDYTLSFKRRKKKKITLFVVGWLLYGHGMVKLTQSKMPASMTWPFLRTICQFLRVPPTRYFIAPLFQNSLVNFLKVHTQYNPPITYHHVISVICLAGFLQYNW